MPQSAVKSARARQGRNRRAVAIDLFAGAGGLSLGLEQAGFDVLAALEYDPVHALTHTFNFPLTEVLCGNAAQVDVTDMRSAAAKGWTAHHPSEPWDEEVDLVAGGPPCQGFSWIGKRQVDDTRNDLIFHFFRLVEALRPRYFIMENVPGMLAGKHRALLDDLIEKFQVAGYHVQPPLVLNAANYGVPQDRSRVILIGSRSDCVIATHPAATHRPARPLRSGPVVASTHLPQGPTVWDALGDLPDLDQYPELCASDTVRLSTAARRRMRQAAAPYARKLSGSLEDEEDFSSPREWDDNLLTSSMRTIHTEMSIARFAATEPGATEQVSRFLRLTEHGLCNTLRAGSGSERGAFTSPRPIHPRLPRVISVREAARLHSFPDWFRLHSTKWNGFRQIGNSVPPRLGRAIGRSVMEALQVKPEKPHESLMLGDVHSLSMSMQKAGAFVGASQDDMPRPRQRLQGTG